jgi:hypothetical protein
LAIVLSVVADREGCRVRTDWEPDELIGAWTLVEGDWKRLAVGGGNTRAAAAWKGALKSLRSASSTFEWIATGWIWPPQLLPSSVAAVLDS